MTDLSGKVAVVTGAARGIGRATALALARAGANVVINVHRDSVDAENCLDELKSVFPGVRRIRADVRDETAVAGMMQSIVSDFGRLDILVNNAGVTRDSLLVNMPSQAWDDVIDTNLKGAFLCSKHALVPMLKARSGAIVNVASIVGTKGNAGQANYSASKAGMIGLTMAIAQEYGSRGIVANAVAPGFIETTMTSGLPESLKQEKISSVLMGRIGTPDDVANVIVSLAVSGYVNGAVVAVDGGVRY